MGLLGLYTVNVRTLWNGRHVCHLSVCRTSVPHQI